MKTHAIVPFAIILFSSAFGCQARLGLPSLTSGSGNGNGSSGSSGSGTGGGPTSEGSASSSEPTAAEKSTATGKTAAPGKSEPSEAEREAEREIDNQLARADEIAKTGKVWLDDAVSGFSPDERLAFIDHFYKPGHAPDAIAGRLKAAMQKQLAAAVASAKKENLTKPGAPDAGAQKAIRKDFETRLPGVQIKAVNMIDSGWKVNHNDFGQVRNRYKNAEVIIGIKGTKVCLAVPADAAQASMGGGTFTTEWEFDQFTQGYAVPCP